jgi:hypothetical protein
LLDNNILSDVKTIQKHPRMRIWKSLRNGLHKPTVQETRVRL